MSVPRACRMGVHLGAVASVVLLGRWLAYALTPDPSAVALGLRDETGGVGPLVVAAVALAAAVVIAVSAVWLVSLGILERSRLEPVPVAPPRVDRCRLLVRAALFTVGSAVAFALLESYLHARAGLGVHGLSCLLGPVHRDVAPILAALSLLASVAVSCAQLIAAWMHRTIGRIAASDQRRASPPPPPRLVVIDQHRPRNRRGGSAWRPRGPPVPVV